MDNCGCCDQKNVTEKVKVKITHTPILMNTFYPMSCKWNTNQCQLIYFLHNSNVIKAVACKGIARISA